MPAQTVLVVDDEKDILELISYNLSRNGYQVVTAKSGEEAMLRVRSTVPDLVVLDLMLPGIDGLDVCRSLKGNPETSHIPVIMISARGEEVDIVTGLELGADDYVTKPFSPRILLARVKAALRKTSSRELDSHSILKRGDLTIDPGRHEILIDHNAITLTSTEFGILHYLARHPGRVYTRNQIIDAVRGDDYAVTSRSVDVQVVGLRKKLKEHGHLIETVRGVGYRLKDS